MSLYRKYRPQTFEDLVGQEHIADTLRNALTARPLRIAHAYLFCGTRGTGKTTAARLLAKCLNCETGPTPTPCNACDFCLRVSNNQTTMDLIELDAASNRSINDAREIIAGVNVAPAQGRYRVYIIDEVHMLTTEAFNALLKTLEEPPPHAVFILATTDAHKVPVTISSRCQRFDFRRVGPQDIVNRLQHVASGEAMKLSDEAARLISASADGALRDALTLLEQVAAFAPETISESDVRLVLGTVSRELLDTLMDAVAARDAVAAIAAIEKAAEEGVSFSQVARDLVSLGRDLLLLTVGYESAAALTDADRKWRHALSQSMGRARLTTFVAAMRGAEKEMRTNTDHRLLLELTLVQQTAEAAPQVATNAFAPQSAAPNANFAPSAAQQNAASPGEYSQNAPPQNVAPTRREMAPQNQTPSQNGASQNQATSQNAAGQNPLRAADQTATTETAEANAAATSLRAASTRDAASPPENASTRADAGAPLSEEMATQNGAANNADAKAATPISSAENAAPNAAVETAPENLAPDENASREYSHAMNGDALQNASNENGEVSMENAAPEAAPQTAKKAGRRINNLAEFQELWPFVLARLKKKIGPTAVAYLHDAQPVALDEREAVLEFKKEFHYEKACEASKRLPFEKVINECMATPHLLKMRIYEPPPAGETVEVPEPEPPPDDDDGDIVPQTDIAELAQTMFGAHVVGRSGAG